VRFTFAVTIVSAFLTAQFAAAQVIGTFERTGDMTEARWAHRATLLLDGRVLITGGENVTSAEIFDPATGTFTPTGRMSGSHRVHAAVRLADGRVLIAGGFGSRSAEIFDPATGTFSPTGEMLEAQGGHSATLLADGRVLIVGGQTVDAPSARAEIFDPNDGTFSFAAAYATESSIIPGAPGPIWATANLLSDGRVLVVANNPPELYDPATGTFMRSAALFTGDHQYGMYWHNATSLADGRVLITGGNDDWTCRGLWSWEIYDPASDTFTSAGRMTASRDLHTGTLLRDGTVLLAGGGDGWCHSSTLDLAEIFDPATGSFFRTGRMTRSRGGHTATLLNDGSVLITGGHSYWPSEVIRSAEIYRPGPARRRAAGH
jgi:hypothetical protein